MLEKGSQFLFLYFDIGDSSLRSPRSLNNNFILRNRLLVEYVRTMHNLPEAIFIENILPGNQNLMEAIKDSLCLID